MSLKLFQRKIIEDFKAHLAGGPFLGGMKQISLADLSAYPIVVLPYRLGFQGDAPWLNHKDVLNWVKEVEKHLPENPFLVDPNSLKPFK